jgi:hypothetical protein
MVQTWFVETSRDGTTWSVNTDGPHYVYANRGEAAQWGLQLRTIMPHVRLNWTTHTYEVL